MAQPAPTRPLKGIVAKLAADIAARLCQLGFIVVTARLLGAQGFGLYSLALFYGFLFSQLADFGLHLLTTREVSKSRPPNGTNKRDTAVASTGAIEYTNDFASVALTAKACLSIVLGVVAALVAFFYGSNWSERLAFLVISSSFVVFSLAEFGFSLFRAWGKLGREAVLVIFNRVSLLLFGSVTLVTNLGLPGLALAHALSAGAATVLALRWARPAVGWQRASWAEVWPLYRQAWPLGLGLILSMLAFRIDVPLLYAFRPENEVGWYSAAYRLFEPGLLIPAALLAGFFPGMVRAAQHSYTELTGYALRLLGSLIALGVIGGLGLILLAPALIELIYGASFAPAADVLRILGLVVPVIFLNYGLTHLLIALHRESWNTFFFGAGLATNVIANLLLIPVFGGRGAAWATLLTELTLCVLCLISLLRFRKATQLPATQVAG